MSHAHNDHIEGLVSVLESIPVKAFMVSAGEDNENYVRIKGLVAKMVSGIYMLMKVSI